MKNDIDISNKLLPIKKVKTIRIAQLGTMLLMGVTSMGSIANTVVYKVTDENGQVVYTDNLQNHMDKKVEVIAAGNTTSYPMATYPATNSGQTTNQAQSNPVISESSTDDKPQQQEQVTYYQINIIEPSAEQAYRKPAQSIEVKVALNPSLKNDDTISILVDGNQIAQADEASISTLELTPGEHQISAVVKNGKTGKQVATASRIVYVIQNNPLIQQKRQLAEQLENYKRLPWYKKAYIRMRQNNIPEAAKIGRAEQQKQNIEKPKVSTAFN